MEIYAHMKTGFIQKYQQRAWQSVVFNWFTENGVSKATLFCFSAVRNREQTPWFLKEEIKQGNLLKSIYVHVG